MLLARPLVPKLKNWIILIHKNHSLNVCHHTHTCRDIHPSQSYSGLVWEGQSGASSVANQWFCSIWHRSGGITCSPASQSYCQTGLLIGRQDQRQYYKPIKAIGTDCQVRSSTAYLRVWSACRLSLSLYLSLSLSGSIWISDETAEDWN